MFKVISKSTGQTIAERENREDAQELADSYHRLLRIDYEIEPSMSDETNEPILHRRKTATYVELNGELLGYVRRDQISNPSPRGGAYRIAHIARTMGGRFLGFFDTRKEAIEAVIAASKTA